MEMRREITSISQSSNTVLIRGCSSACRLNQSASRWYPGSSSFNIIESHICRESAHSNTGSGLDRCWTGVNTAELRVVAATTVAGRLDDVSAINVGVVLFTSGRTLGDGMAATHVSLLPWIGAHCTCTAQQCIHSLTQCYAVCLQHAKLCTHEH